MPVLALTGIASVHRCRSRLSIISCVRNDVGAGQIDLVDHRNHVQAIADGQIGIRQVCASTPWEASTTSNAPSQEARERETS